MKTTAHNFGAGCLILFALPFVVLGTGGSVAFVRGLGRGGEMPVVLGIVGMIFAVIGCALIVIALTARKRWPCWSRWALRGSSWPSSVCSSSA